MVELLELPLKMPEPEISPEQVAQLLGVLASAAAKPVQFTVAGDPKPHGWMTAGEIAARLGDEVTDRLVRKIASAACPSVVSYPGSPGYKLWQHCTVAEIDHCIEAIESQAKDMLKRSVMYRQAYHRSFRGAPGGAIAMQSAMPTIASL